MPEDPYRRIRLTILIFTLAAIVTLLGLVPVLLFW
jgi:hypothetical protein